LGDVPQEARWLVGFWMGKALAAPRRTCAPWMKSGKWPGCFWGESIRARLVNQVQHIRHWRVVESSYADVDTSQSATWFVDPPYQVKGVHYRGGRPDYAHLAAWCAGLSGQVIVCGGRAFADSALLYEKLDDLHRRRPITRLVHGACPRGADRFAKLWARSRGVREEPYEAALGV
jgi:hypothetical protein